MKISIYIVKYLWKINKKIKLLHKEIVSYMHSKSFVCTDVHLQVLLGIESVLWP